MNEQFETLKQGTEAELGRAIDAEEEHTLKMLYYFGKGVQLKAQLDAGAERIGPIAERVFADIERQRDHRRAVMQATAEFLAGKSKLRKPREIQTPRESNLFVGIVKP